MKKLLAKITYQAAVQSANQGCPFFFYQDKVPQKVKKLRKF